MDFLSLRSTLAALAFVGAIALPVGVAAAQPSVAVLAIVNDGIDPWYGPTFDPGKALAALVTDKLANAGRVSVVERENIEKIFDEQKLSQSADFAQANPVKLGQMVGARYLITGHIVHLDKVGENKSLVGGLFSTAPINIGGVGMSAEKVRLAVSLRVTDANTGRIVKTYVFDRASTGTSFIAGDVSTGVGGYQSQTFASSSVGKLITNAADDFVSKIDDKDFGGAGAGSGTTINAIIIAVDGTNFIINKGANDGVIMGAFLNTFHQISTKDPTSGQTLVTDVPDGSIEIISVSTASAVARKVTGSPVVNGIARSS
ncbi:MAG: CsgG/HfaB family protein [Candidatus Eremiobacteraeota bacterium]|nr:CsgG/HfaB family protein [Candidatus Eremiobacteraeota bacterium]